LIDLKARLVKTSGLFVFQKKNKNICFSINLIFTLTINQIMKNPPKPTSWHQQIDHF